MQLFYITRAEDNHCLLSEEESWHCMKVLRLKEGDVIDMTDGLGRFYRGPIVTIHQKRCIAVISEQREFQSPGWKLHIAIAPTKNIDRFEWFLEKSTEIGISQITPVFCEHSERVTVKPERLEKVVIAAMKQSLNPWLPELNPPVKFKDFLHCDHPGQRFIAYCETGNESELHKICQAGQDVVVLIGPEGDFSKAEVEQAVKQNFTPVNLGPNRLRTETAGVVACHTINLLNR